MRVCKGASRIRVLSRDDATLSQPRQLQRLPKLLSVYALLAELGFKLVGQRTSACQKGASSRVSRSAWSCCQLPNAGSVPSTTISSPSSSA